MIDQVTGKDMKQVKDTDAGNIELLQVFQELSKIENFGQSKQTPPAPNNLYIQNWGDSW